MTRLRNVSCQDPGWRRLPWGRGFRYVDEDGEPLTAAQVERIKELVIPPAWTEVWICPHERGHLQAVGTDAAGRRQYLYHPVWQRKQSDAKFERVIDVGRRLPAVRRQLHEALTGDPLDRDTTLAATIRLVDLGCFRLGSEEYAEENGSFGLTTLEVRHVRRARDQRRFCFVGKAGIEHDLVVDDPAVIRVVDALAKNRPRDSQLLAPRAGRRRVALAAAEVNARIRDLFGLDVTAKDLRTWKATATVAGELAAVDRASSRTARARQVRAAIGAAAELLGNTPTVARSSYVHPRVVDLFEDGTVIGPTRSENGLDRAVVRLLSG